MLKYTYRPEALEIREAVDGQDTEFRIRIIQTSPYLDAFKTVQRFFEDNNDYTDVLFYAYPNHEYRIIVHHDHYEDFLAEMMKRRLLRSLEWTD